MAESTARLSSQMRARTYVLCPSYRRVGNGTDFYADFIHLCRSFGLRTVNTFLLGKSLCPLVELAILCVLPLRSIVITTWPGCPYQYLVLPCIVNRVRFAVFSSLVRLKRIQYNVMPVDRPLDQYAHRLSPTTLSRQRGCEARLLSCVSAFLCCGSEMASIYRVSYPSARIVRLDMYDQVLPDARTGARAHRGGPARIAVAGNLARMSRAIRDLPAVDGVQYVLTGPGSGDIANSGREDFVVLGNVPEKDLLQSLSDADFGLVLYDSRWSTYFSSVIAGKLTTYLLAGLPILCPARYKSMAEFVQRSGTGLVIEDYEDIRRIPLRESLTDAIRAKVAREARRIKQGLHYKEAIVELQELLLRGTS